MRGLPYASAGLPRRPIGLLAMTKVETYAWASLAWLGPAPPWAKARFAPPCLSPGVSNFRPWLPYCAFLKAKRKPMKFFRLPFALPVSRLAERNDHQSEVDQAPPRETRSEPDAGPTGSVKEALV
jgi:hypothetical protein